MLQAIHDALARHDAAAALELVQQALLERADEPDLHHALALVHRARGDLKAALTALDKAIELAPEQAHFLVTRAALALGQNDAEAAKIALSQAIEHNPNQLSAYVLGTQSAISRGDLAGAEAQLKLGQRVNPDHPLIIAVEGNLAAARGDLERAVKLLSAASKAAPNDTLILSSLGLVFLHSGQFAFAEQALRRSIALKPAMGALRWPLIEALRAQNRLDEVIRELQSILGEAPDNQRAVLMLGHHQLMLGQIDEALASYRRLLAAKPPIGALDGMLEMLSRAGQAKHGLQIVEELLQETPQADQLWQRRLALESGNFEAGLAVLARWREACPNSPIMGGTKAQIEEAGGELDAAEASADACLAVMPGLVGPLQIKLRALLRRDPAACLAYAEKFGNEAESELGKRLATVWRGFALDALGRGDEAAQCWRESQAATEGQRGLPGLTPLGAVPAAAADDGIAPRLLWGPMGSRVFELVNALREVQGFAMLDDRFGSGPRQDGLWPPRADGGIATPKGWRHLLERADIDPATALDWLPHWDGLIDASLPGNQLIAVIADPRDLFLNALVFGGPQPWIAPDPMALAQFIKGNLDLLAERQRAAADRTLLIHADALEQQPEQVAKRVANFLGLQKPLRSSAFAETRRGLGRSPLCFAPGHWQLYNKAFADEFALLAQCNIGIER
ncbi:tetratricopeptide repeat protein [Pseudomarimonas arenosa]|uniref:Tetratricopeptide repeat protein n=1 Tax=Pseudomarimonas arenosa TaxID=2774145 RepID=A0AAW3ZR60_9GAMM|nr:tetratricopeptide repeat protein [Pseudomarimonas arenosa]MBD8526746.1 tetratricopeptide repeat protein [Pseudomarimonas arenosa]